MAESFESAVLQRLASIEAKLEVRCVAHGESISEIKEQQEKQEERTRVLEGWKMGVTGWAACVALLVTLAVQFAKQMVGK